MSEASTEVAWTAIVCPQCGAEQLVGRSACWLCRAPLSDMHGQTHGGGAPVAAPYSFSISTMLLITTLVAICCGLLASYPGLGVIVSILLAPVLVRTAKVVRHREAAGASVPLAEKIALGATSFAVTLVIATVVGFAAFCCLCATCATLFGLGSGDASVIGIAAAAAVLGLLSVAISVALFKWSRRRYLRDIQPPGSREETGEPNEGLEQRGTLEP